MFGQDKFFPLSVALGRGRNCRQSYSGDSQCLLASAGSEVRTLVRCRYRRCNHKSRFRLWGVAFGIPPFAPEAMSRTAALVGVFGTSIGMM
jgi:hypothetical protein